MLSSLLPPASRPFSFPKRSQSRGAEPERRLSSSGHQCSSLSKICSSFALQSLKSQVETLVSDSEAPSLSEPSAMAFSVQHSRKKLHLLFLPLSFFFQS